MVKLAKAMRSTAAAAMPIRMARLRCRAGSPAAAMPTTMALSPASATSMATTCNRAVMDSQFMAPVYPLYPAG